MDALGGIPIRRDRRDLLSVDRAEELLRAGESVAIFPQGTVQGGAWTRGAARLALATGSPLVPVRIIGTKRAFSKGRIRFSKSGSSSATRSRSNGRGPRVAAAKALTPSSRSGSAQPASRTVPCHGCHEDERKHSTYQDPPERPADPAVRRADLRRIVALFRPYRRRLQPASSR